MGLFSLRSRYRRRIWPAGPVQSARSRQQGLTLLEALIALAVLALAFATTLAIQGDLMGAAGANRVRAAAMGLAESKLEELRSLPFYDPALNLGAYLDTQEVESFTIFNANNALQLHRCWSITARDDLKVLSVAVARTAAACQPAGGGDTLVLLRSLLAENDLLLAARNTNLNPLLNPDGQGRIDRVDPDDYSSIPTDDAGFRRIELPGGVLAIMSPDGTVLVPDQRDDRQLIATINGNILISGRSCNFASGVSIQQACGLTMYTEGNILCEMYVPGGGSELAVISGDEAGVDDFYLLAYRCVAANQWRRSIALFPLEDPNEKVCVGHPGLVINPADPTDSLKSFVRFYDGRQEERVDGEVVNTSPHGLAGEDIDSEDPAAVIGSVCKDEGAACAQSNVVRALVPGGHHFMVMDDRAGSCSARMRELSQIDTATGSLYESLLARNPSLLSCTSEKTYQGEFCTGTTLVSGFIDNQTNLNGREFLVRSSGSSLGQSCTHAGPFEDEDGIFVCAFLHTAGDNARVLGQPASAFEDDIVFSDMGEKPFLEYPLDVVNQELVIVGAGGTFPPPTPGPDPTPEPGPTPGPDPTPEPGPTPTTCNITVSGTKQANNATVAVQLGSGSFSNCANQSPGYRCNLSSVAQGTQVNLRSTRPGNHPVLFNSFTANCGNTSVTVNF